MSALAPVADRIAKLLRMALGATSDGETLSAVMALRRTLKAAGSDLHELTKAITTGGELSEADMRKLYDAGYMAGLKEGESRSVSVFHDVDEDWHPMRDFCAQHSQRLRSREREFIESLKYWRGGLTTKQSDWLNGLYARLQRKF